MAVDSVATGVVLVRIDACASRSGPIIVVVSVVVAVLRRRVIAGQIARVVADDVDAMATGGHGFLQPMEAAKVVQITLRMTIYVIHVPDQLSKQWILVAFC